MGPASGPGRQASRGAPPASPTGSVARSLAERHNERKIGMDEHQLVFDSVEQSSRSDQDGEGSPAPVVCGNRLCYKL